MSEQPNNAGYETRDVAVGPLALAAAGLGALTLVSFASMWLLFGYFENREAKLSAPASPLAEARGRRLPPLPRLEATLPAKLAELRSFEDKALNTYGWVDAEAGVIRIPIDRAMQLYLERREAQQ